MSADTNFLPLFIYQGLKGERGSPGTAGLKGESVRDCITLSWMLVLDIFGLKLSSLLQGPPGNPGYQGQAGLPVSISS